MKFLMIGSMPVEVGNQLLRQGKLSSVIQAALEAVKPEAVYFGLKDGKRTVFMVVEMQDASQMPGIAEPLFLGFSGSLECIPLMTPQDVAKAGPSLDAAAKKFGG